MMAKMGGGGEGDCPAIRKGERGRGTAGAAKTGGGGKTILHTVLFFARTHNKMGGSEIGG